MRHSQLSPYGTRYWLLDTLPSSISAWTFKSNHARGTKAFHSLQPTPSGLTLRTIAKGTWTIKMSNQVMQAYPGDIFAAYPDIFIEFYTNSSEWEWYELQFNGPAGRDFLSSFGCTESQSVYSPINKHEPLKLFKQIYNYMSLKNRSIWKLQSLVYELLDKCNPSSSLQESKKASSKILVDKVIDLIETIPATKMNISELADTLQVDRSTLRRSFQAQMQMNPIDFIKKIRIERATELLIMTDLSIAAIAKSVGFSNAKYFIRCFREQTGLPPRKWKIKKKAANHQKR